MYSRARAAASRSAGSAKASGSGTAPSTGTTWAGLVPHVTCGAEPAASMVTVLANDGALVGAPATASLEGLLPLCALRGVGAAFEVGEGRVVGGDHPGAGAGLDRHVADRHAPLHGQGGDGRAPVLDHVADPPAGADAPDHGQDDVLGRHPGRGRALDLDGHRGGAALGEGLGGEDVLDLGGADAEGQGAEGAVGGGVAVAADDRHARQGEAELGADDMDDALVAMAHREAGDPELRAVGGEHLELAGRDGVGHRLVDVGGGHVVVGGGHRQLGVAHAPAGQPQAVEGLRRGHLVDQVEVDEEQVGLALGAVDDVAVPDLLAEGAGRRLIVQGLNRPRRSRREACRPGDSYSTTSPGPLAEQGLAQGGAGGDHAQLLVALLDRPDQEALDPRRRPRSGCRRRSRRPRCPTPPASAPTTTGLLQGGLELADPGLHLPLGVLGGVVVAVLGQVAEGPGGLDGPGDLHPAPGGEVLELGLEPLVGGWGEVGLVLGHPRQDSGSPGRPRQARDGPRRG